MTQAYVSCSTFTFNSKYTTQGNKYAKRVGNQEVLKYLPAESVLPEIVEVFCNLRMGTIKLPVSDTFLGSNALLASNLKECKNVLKTTLSQLPVLK